MLAQIYCTLEHSARQCWAKIPRAQDAMLRMRVIQNEDDDDDDEDNDDADDAGDADV